MSKGRSEEEVGKRGDDGGRRWAPIDLERSINLLDKAIGGGTTSRPSLSDITPSRMATSTPAVHSLGDRRSLGADFSQFNATMIGSPRTPGAASRTRSSVLADQHRTPSVFATPAGVSHASSPSLFQTAIGQSTRADRTLMNSTAADTLSDTTATTDILHLLDENPDLASCESLFQQFQSAFSAPASQTQGWELLRKYAQTLAQRTDVLSKILTTHVVRGNRGEARARYSEMAQTHKLLDGEQWTWSLLSTLFKDVLESAQINDSVTGEEDIASSIIESSLGISLDDCVMIERLYERSPSMRRSQIVVDWLEKMAAHKMEESQYVKMGYLKDHAGTAWENTLHMLKQKGGRPNRGVRTFVTEMDPDAPLRQHQPLFDLDAEDEKWLLKLLFLHVRSGRLDLAQELCVNSGQAWRAASLEGWRLYHDPNLTCDKQRPLVGNPQRDLWKRMCWELASNDSCDPMERALYGSQCGALSPVLAVCHSWDDALWAYSKALVDSEVESHLRLHLPASRATEHQWVDMPEEYWSKELTLEKIFTELESHPNSAIRDESESFYRVIQKYVILGELTELMKKMAGWSMDPQTPGPLLRFMAHFVLFFRKIRDTALGDDEETTVLQSYVNLMIAEKRTTLVATYAAVLPAEGRIESYCRFLQGIQGTDEREKCLSFAQTAGLDTREITRVLVVGLRKQYAPSSNTAAAAEGDSGGLITGFRADTTEGDNVLIDAIEWLTFDPSQSLEAIYQGCAIVRTFLALGKLPAARELFSRLPATCVDLIIQSEEEEEVATDPKRTNTVKEYLCIKAYLDTQESFNDWFEVFYNRRPSEPPAFPALGPKEGGSELAQQVAIEQRTQAYRDALKRWTASQGTMTQVTLDRLYNVLLFPKGGWMIDPIRADASDDQSDILTGFGNTGLGAMGMDMSEDSDRLASDIDSDDDDGDNVDVKGLGRQSQLAHLRRLCIPTVFTLLHKVLSSTGRHQECFKLCDLLASEQHKLYKVFSKGELQTFLRSMHPSSLALLGDNKDALGYDRDP